MMKLLTTTVIPKCSRNSKQTSTHQENIVYIPRLTPTSSQHMQIRNCGGNLTRVAKSPTTPSSTDSFFSIHRDDFESSLGISSKRSSKNLSIVGSNDISIGEEMSPFTNLHWRRMDGFPRDSPRRSSRNEYLERSLAKLGKQNNSDDSTDIFKEAAVDQLQASFNDLYKKFSDALALLRHTSSEVAEVVMIIQTQHSHSKDILDMLSTLQNAIQEDTRVCERVGQLHDTIFRGIASVDDGGHYLDKTIANLLKEKEIIGLRIHSSSVSKEKCALKKHRKELDQMIHALQTKKWILEEFIDEVSKEVESYQEKLCEEYSHIHETSEIIGQFTQEEEIIVGELHKHLLQLEETHQKMKSKCSLIEEIKGNALKRFKEMESTIRSEDQPVAYYMEQFRPLLMEEIQKFWLEINQPAMLTDYINHIAAKLEKFSQQIVAVKETQRRQVYLLKRTQQEVWNSGTIVRELASKTLQLQTQIKQMQDELKRDSSGTSFEEPLLFQSEGSSANGSVEGSLSSAQVSAAGESVQSAYSEWTVIETDRTSKIAGSQGSFVVVTPRSLPSTPGAWWEPSQ